MNGNRYLTYLIIISLFVISVRILMILNISPRIDPDSPWYIEHIKLFYEGKGFATQDYVDNKIKPTAHRMPLFQYISYILMKILNLDTSYIIKSAFIVNFIASNLILILSFVFSYILSKNLYISFITFFITAIDLNIIYNSSLIMTDTLYAFICLLFLISFITAIKNEKNIFFISSGLLLGLSVMTRPLTKYYPLILLIMLPLISKEKRTEYFKKVLLLTFGFMIIITPWIIRNHKKMGFWGLNTDQGLNLLWSVSHLVEKCPTDSPIISGIKDIIMENKKNSPWPMQAEIDARKKYQLSEIEISNYFEKIAKETIIKKPLSFLKIYIRHIINNITSATSELKMIDILLKDGYYDTQHKIMIRFENIEKSDKKDINFKEFLIILPNFFFRIINLILFIIAIKGGVIYTKRHKEIGFFLLSFIAYCVALSSIVGSYDRYRLPFETIIDFFISYFIYTKIFITNKNISKNVSENI